jgi:hypothetical protein
VLMTVIHRIHDPEGLQAAEANALEAGLPSYVALPIHATTNDHGFGICIWEGAVDTVREVVEGTRRSAPVAGVPRLSAGNAEPFG